MTKAIKRTKRKLFIASALIIFLIFSSQIFSAEILGVYFPPYKDSYLPVVKLYDSSQRYIHLAIYSLTKDEFAEALIRAHNRGVER